MLDTYLLTDYIFLRAHGGMSEAQFQTWLEMVTAEHYSDATSKAAVLAVINQAITDRVNGKISSVTFEDQLRNSGIRVTPKRK